MSSFVTYDINAQTFLKKVVDSTKKKKESENLLHLKQGSLFLIKKIIKGVLCIYFHI